MTAEHSMNEILAIHQYHVIYTSVQALSDAVHPSVEGKQAA